MKSFYSQGKLLLTGEYVVLDGAIALAVPSIYGQSLDIEKGGEVALRLESLYQYTLSQLTIANIKSDRKTLENIIKILSPLNNAWEQLFHASTKTEEGVQESPRKITSKC